LAILRLYYIVLFKRPIRDNNSKSLDYLINSDKFESNYIDDAPVNVDLFNIDPFLSSLAYRIKSVNSSVSNVLGLVGPWGSGKTTALRLVSDNYLHDEYVLIEFDAWSDVGGKSAIIELIGAIVSKTSVVSKHSLSVKEFVRSLTTSGNTWVSLSGAILDSSLKDASDALRSELNAALIDNNQHLLIVVDNLDRASPETIKELMAALNGVFRISNTTFVLLYDTENMSNVVDQSYLDKIVVHPIYMPRISPYQYRRVLYSAVGKIIPSSVDFLSIRATIEQISLLINTPRDLVITLNIILGISKQPYQYFNYLDMIAVRFIEHFNNSLYRDLLGSWLFVCTRNTGYIDLKYSEHRNEFLSHLKKTHAEYWSLICELLQILEFNNQFSDKSTIRDYSIRDALYYPVYMHWMASDYHETDALFDYLASNGYKNIDSVMNRISSDSNRYDMEHFVRRIQHNITAIPLDLRAKYATMILKNSQLIYPKGSSYADILCRNLLNNCSIQIHDEFLKSASSDYSKLFTLVRMYYGMKTDSENTEDIRQLYLETINAMREEIFDGTIDLYNDYYSKYNIWGLGPEENKDRIDNYLSKVITNGDSALKFLEDLMVEKIEYTTEGSNYSRIIDHKNVLRISSEEFVRNAFEIIDPNKFDKEKLEAYGAALSYFNEKENAR